MYDFKLTEGDVAITRDIETVSNNDMLEQTVETILSTYKGEWFLNPEQGLDYWKVLKKTKNFDMVKNEILNGLLQIDSSFIITEINCGLSDKRELTVEFKAKSNKQSINYKGVVNV